MEKEFKIGDIVYHKCGRMCNGKYGYVAIGPYDTLCVLDNERAPECEVKGNEHLLSIVGHMDKNPELLNIWSYQDPFYTIEDLRDFYKKYQDDLTKNFDDMLNEMKASFRYKVKKEAFTNILLKKLKEKYPEYIIIEQGCHDDPETIGIYIYNIPDDIYTKTFKLECKSMEDECYDLVHDINHGEFDVLFFLKSETITNEHYSHILEKYSKKGE